MMMTPHSSPPSLALPLLLLLVTLLVTLPSSASKRTASQKARNRARISQLRFGKLHSKVKEAAAPNRSALVGNYDGLCWDAAVFGDTDYPLTRRQCRRAVVTSGNVELMQDGVMGHAAARRLDRAGWRLAARRSQCVVEPTGHL